MGAHRADGEAGEWWLRSLGHMGKDCCHSKEEGADVLSAQGVPPGLLPGETAASLCATLCSMRARLGPCNKPARTGGCLLSLPEAGSPRSKPWQSQFLLRTLFLA